MKKVLLLIVTIILVILVFVIIRHRSQNNPHIIRVSGNIEVDDVELSFKISGRVEERLVSEGDTVKKNQTVATLEKYELINEVNIRKAEVESAEAFLAELEAGSRPEEIAQAEVGNGSAYNILSIICLEM